MACLNIKRKNYETIEKSSVCAEYNLGQTTIILTIDTSQLD